MNVSDQEHVGQFVTFSPVPDKQFSQSVLSIAAIADLILCSCLLTSIYTVQSPGAAAILPQAPPAPGHGL